MTVSRGLPRGLLALILIAAPTLAAAHPAEVENIPPGQYVPVALREIQRAASSIHLTMYLITLPASRQGSVVHRLVDALVEAQRRGVRVTVVLDQNLDWVEGRRTAATEKNAAAAAALRAGGVAVAFDDEAVYTHAKVLIVDDATVLLGSTNWTETALTRNVEGTVLIRSAALAEELRTQFSHGAREGRPPSTPVPAERVVQVPEAFLTDAGRLGQMARYADERAFDLYLALLRQAAREPDAALTPGYAALAAALGLPSTVGWYHRFAVRRVLARLQDRYRLITYDAPWAREPTVRLTAMPGDRFVSVPDSYWTWGWDRRLTFGGKALFLISRWETARAAPASTWFRSQEDLAARHGMSIWFIGDGLQALRRHNVLEVTPGTLNPADFSDRQANRYTLNPLYDPKALDQALAALEAQHGTAAAARARRYAATVYEDRDLRAITRLIALEQEFGPAVVRRAVTVVGALSGNNPKKTVGYLVGVIQRMGADEQTTPDPLRDRL